MKYSSLVIEHFNQPRNIGVLDASQSNVVVARRGQPDEGNVLHLYIEFDEQGFAQSSRIKVYGDPYVIAAASLATELIQNKTIDELQAVSYDYFVEQLDIPKTKWHSALLVEDAIKEACHAFKSLEVSYE